MEKNAPTKPIIDIIIDLKLLVLTHNVMPYKANNKKKTIYTSLKIRTEYNVTDGNNAIVHPTLIAILLPQITLATNQLK